MSNSPFLNGTTLQWAWDSTSLGWFKECPRKYYYAMIVGWRPKAETVNLKFGQLYHTGLEHYDKARALGMSHEEALIDSVQLLLTLTWERGRPDKVDGPWESDHNTKTRETLIRSIVWYIDQFGKDDQPRPSC